MGFKYLIIDSHAADRTSLRRAFDPTLNIKLDHPIKNATKVQLMSFSSPNNYSNVRENNNSFDCMLYNYVAVPFIERRSYRIDPGLYTISELVEALNVAAAAEPFGRTPGSPTLTPVFSLLANNRVTITCSSAGNTIRRFTLYSDNYFNSIVSRLGFSRHQVFSPEFDSRSKDDFLALNLEGDSINSPGKLFGVGPGGTVLIDGQPESEWYALGAARPLVWKTNSVGETKTSSTVGRETYQHLLMKSDLVNQDVETVYKNPDGSVVSRSFPVLAKIQCTVGLYSYLHWNTQAADQSFVHTLSGKTIQSFSLTLCDDTGLEFQIDESKNFTAVLRFEIAEPNNQVTLENNLRNQELRFKAEHGCLR
jgi:hypothetical protein